MIIGGAVTVNVAAVDVPPPGAGVTTVMEWVPLAATSLANNAAVNCVAEAYVAA